MGDALVYVYAVGDAGLARSDVLGSIAGIDDTPVRVIDSGELAAVVSSVDAERFDEESLRRNLEDLQWLERVARAHHVVVDALGRVHAVAPVRLATVYIDDANVRALLTDHAAAFSGALARIRGRTELGVKGYAVSAPEDGREPVAASGDKPGTAYLTRRRTERERSSRVRRQALDAAEQVHRELAELAVASRRYPAQDPRLTGRSEEMVLNTAYLVDEAGARALEDALAAHAGASVRYELTGPWAPYSFATLEES